MPAIRSCLRFWSGALYLIAALLNAAWGADYCKNAHNPGEISIGLIQTGHYADIETRLKNLGFAVTRLSPTSGIDEFKNHTIVYLPSAWASSFYGARSDIEKKAASYSQYIQGGGGLVVDNPDQYNYTLTVLPYKVTFNNSEHSAGSADWPPLILNPLHKITAGLSDEGLPGPSAVITSNAAEYEVLMKSRQSASPTLLVAQHGAGRIVVHSSDAAYVSRYPISDRVYRRMIYWAANMDIDDTALGATILQTLRVPGKTVSVDISGTTLFTGTRDSLVIWDISNLPRISRVSAIKLFNSLKLLRCYGHYVIAADSLYFALIDVTDKNNPVIKDHVALLDRYGEPNTPEGMDVFDQTAHVFARKPTLSVMNQIFCISLANPDALSVFNSIVIDANSSFPYQKSGVWRTAERLYCACDESSEENFKIYNVKNLLSPTYLGGLDLDDLLPRYYEDDLDDLALLDTVAFVAGDGGTQNGISAGLVAAIDVASPSHPSMLSHLLVPASATNLRLYGHYAFVTGSAGLSITDVQSPAHIYIKDFTPYQAGFQDCVLFQDYLFLISSDTGVVVIDTNLPDEFPPYIDRGSIIVVPPNPAGEVKLIGPLSAITDWHPPVKATISNSSSGQLVMQQVEEDGHFTATLPASMKDILFIAASDDHIPANTSIPMQLPSVSPANLAPFSHLQLAGTALDLEIAGDLVYLAMGANGIAVVEVTDPKAPRLILTLPMEGYVEDIRLSDHYLFAACNRGGLQVVDITNPMEPVKLAGRTIAGHVKGIEVREDIVCATVSNVTSSHVYETLYIYKMAGSSLIEQKSLIYWDANVYGTPPDPAPSAVGLQGKYAFICDKNADLVVVDISNPQSPVKLKSFALQDSYGKGRMRVFGNQIFCLGGDIEVVDITDPKHPTALSRWYPAGSTEDLLLSGDYAITCGSKGVGLYDLSNFHLPSFLDFIGAPGSPQRIILCDSLLYLADGSSGLTVVNLQSTILKPKHAPSSFKLVEPVDGSTVVQFPLRLTWQAAADHDYDDHITYTVFCDTVKSPAFIWGSTQSETTLLATRGLPDSTLYYWTVVAVDKYGLATACEDTFTFRVMYQSLISAPVDNHLPDHFYLDHNYPNPFNPQTTVNFALPCEAEVTISVYDLRGRLVQELVNGKKQAGYYSVLWDGANLPSGTYFIKMHAADYRQIIKCVLVR